MEPAHRFVLLAIDFPPKLMGGVQEHAKKNATDLACVAEQARPVEAGVRVDLAPYVRASTFRVAARYYSLQPGWKRCVAAESTSHHCPE